MKACPTCYEIIGNFKNPPPQFNCKDCWEIINFANNELKELLQITLECIQADINHSKKLDRSPILRGAFTGTIATQEQIVKIIQKKMVDL